MIRKINFGAGPATLPEEVLKEYAAACLNYNNTGLSILELPHRGADFVDIINESTNLVKKLCGLGDDYEVVWIQGGGRMQFGMIPLNFLPPKQTAGFIDTGHWSQEAAEYTKFYGKHEVLASSASNHYRTLPNWPDIPAGIAYVHITTNNTIYGTQWDNIPECSVPLIADMSSDILSAEQDYTKFDLFYAAAQKNLGTPGVSLVAIKKSLLAKANKPIPPFFSFSSYVKKNSLVNTANVSAVYASLLMLRWIDKKGIAAIEQENNAKAALLYSAIDKSSIFNAVVTRQAHRSKMNVCFTAVTKEIEQLFNDLCKDNNITGIAGHRYTGGFRVSLYNAVPIAHVQTLVALMEGFEANL